MKWFDSSCPNKMKCRLCLGDFADLLNLFEEEAQELTRACILQQHFWFELTPNDPISTFICPECWSKVIDFHQFYKSIEAAHSVLSGIHLYEALEQTVIAEATAKTVSTANHLFAKEDPIEFIIKEEFIDEAQYDECIAATNETNSEPEQQLSSAENGDHCPTADVPKNPTVGYKRKKLPEDKTTHSEPEQQLSTVENGDHRPAGDVPKNLTVSYKRKKLREDKAKLVKKHIVMGCELCVFVGDDFNQIIGHFKLHHTNTNAYIRCCGRKLRNNSKVVEHAQKHEDPELFKCKVCQKAFASKNILRSHKLRQHPSAEDLKFKCTQCDKGFSQIYLLKYHSLIHMPESEHKFRCYECPQPKTFPSESLYKQHVAVHRKPSYFCPICGKEHRNKACHEHHMRKHAGAVDLKVDCPIPGCNKSVDKGYLEKHIEIHNDKFTKCDKCDKVLKPGSLRSHYQYVHDETKPFCCEFCGKRFPQNYALQEHRSTHTGVPLRRCRFCERKFNFNCNRITHMKSIHPVEYEKWRNSKEEKSDAPKDETQSPSKVSTSTETCSRLLDT